MAMRKFFGILLGLGFLAALPALAETPLKVDFRVRGLAPGALVWLEVRPEVEQVGAPGELASDAASAVSAQGESVWQLEVPASGSASPGPHMFSFPMDLDRTSADHQGIIRLTIRFKIDAGAGQPKTDGDRGYGQLHELTLAMPVSRGSAPLERCFRLRETGDRMVAESAANCLDASFAKSKVSRFEKAAQ
jgi:hypothetical protein